MSIRNRFDKRRWLDRIQSTKSKERHSHEAEGRVSVFIRTNFRYHPVGQGLFTSSFLSVVGLSQRFTWVFDCGTSSSQHLIDDAMSHVVPGRMISPDKGQLDLVAISHFDEDHVSGLIRLLRRFDIDILLLPYVPLWERMLLAFHEDVGPDDPFLDFFVNPVAYLRANSRSEEHTSELQSRGLI